jgi:Uncharacterized protein conserved in bacteria (DUF2147)
VLVSAGSALADPKGLWLAQDGAHVRVGPCGAALCATIAKPKSSVDPQTGLPWTDRNNPDPARRSRPLIGVPVLYGLVPESPPLLDDCAINRHFVNNCRTKRAAGKAAPPFLWPISERRPDRSPRRLHPAFVFQDAHSSAIISIFVPPKSTPILT